MFMPNRTHNCLKVVALALAVIRTKRFYKNGK